ncbi:DUF4188 domain-containing protein [Rhodococcus erythropolis]|uniref:DUF4188 domain-containing protein n=1 Tax=Rhodococcus erythropolis TaxID=1833 RepID=UPI00210CD0BF|nr:DUF4188 domain-containing protein [Rhodococcus erythropolis]MCQ4128288.1 DUF4188 domain-containing protein [Rhodococcus erythropolis]
MSKINYGRTTHSYSETLVVFHIGMTPNRWWRPDLWLPAFLAMPPMVKELSADPDSGLLGYEMLFNRNGPYVVQYWSSVEKLYEYASATSQHHRPAWSKFNRTAQKSPGAVGVWHETFVVERAESMFVDTRTMGLPKATQLIKVGAQNARAQTRLAHGRVSSS